MIYTTIAQIINGNELIGYRVLDVLNGSASDCHLREVNLYEHCSNIDKSTGKLNDASKVGYPIVSQGKVYLFAYTVLYRDSERVLLTDYYGRLKTLKICELVENKQYYKLSNAVYTSNDNIKMCKVKESLIKQVGDISDENERNKAYTKLLIAFLIGRANALQEISDTSSKYKLSDYMYKVIKYNSNILYALSRGVLTIKWRDGGDLEIALEYLDRYLQSTDIVKELIKERPVNINNLVEINTKDAYYEVFEIVFPEGLKDDYDNEISINYEYKHIKLCVANMRTSCNFNSEHLLIDVSHVNNGRKYMIRFRISVERGMSKSRSWEYVPNVETLQSERLDSNEALCIVNDECTNLVVKRLFGELHEVEVKLIESKNPDVVKMVQIADIAQKENELKMEHLIEYFKLLNYQDSTENMDDYTKNKEFRGFKTLINIPVDEFNYISCKQGIHYFDKFVFLVIDGRTYKIYKEFSSGSPFCRSLKLWQVVNFNLKEYLRCSYSLSHRATEDMLKYIKHLNKMSIFARNTLSSEFNTDLEEPTWGRRGDEIRYGFTGALSLIDGYAYLWMRRENIGDKPDMTSMGFIDEKNEDTSVYIPLLRFEKMKYCMKFIADYIKLPKDRETVRLHTNDRVMLGETLFKEGDNNKVTGYWLVAREFMRLHKESQYKTKFETDLTIKNKYHIIGDEEYGK